MLTLEDTLTRWERMRGKRTLYLPGTDHASIAVQMQVVKHLQAQGIDFQKIGREKFLEECWKWIESYQPRIYGQIKAMGVSCDWSRVKFTMDEDLNRAVNHAFVQLYKKKSIYRAQKLVNWCPKSLTVLSDIEVIFEEKNGKLWHIRYPLKDNPSEFLIVATTRPETLLGDVAVAVHPEDERYKKWIGKELLLPFTDRSIPVIADDFVDKSFGSGVVKITPAHDFTDFEVGVRHSLPILNVFTPDAKIIEGLPAEAASFAGLDRFVARAKIVDRLKEMNLLEKEEAHTNRVGISERGGVPVEPYLSYQWFCKMDGMAASVVEDLKNDAFRFVPHEFENQFLRWMENIRDWCISRQLWWGHAIPVYHCLSGSCQHVEVSEVAVEKCTKCGASTKPDADVLDTWFSSALWPFSTLGWPHNTEDFKKYYPTQVLETGFDILFFWVARMLMMGKELTGKIPFKHIYMHPLVRDEHGHKMSKSKGNTIDPLDIINSVGSDTLRMSLNALCVQGRDLRLSVDRIEGYRNFLNKIWNATRFVMMETEAGDWRNRPASRGLTDDWIYSRLDDCAFKVNKAWEEFRVQEAAETIYHFAWNDFCDWFLEISKSDRKGSQNILLYVLSEILKILHPICPHLTEELWHELPGVAEEESLAVQLFPKGKEAQVIEEFKFLQDLVVAIRVLRNENKVAPGQKIKIYSQLAGEESVLLQKNLPWVTSLSKTEFQLSSYEGAHSVVTAALQGRSHSFKVPLTELVNVAEERVRLQKEISQIQAYIGTLNSKLSNEGFLARAPQNVVDIEKNKLREAEDKIQKLSDNLKQLESL
jgi:valyl-tRNA synthetase